jgi:hypothetical protein
MRIRSIKTTLAVGWVLAAILIGAVAGVQSAGALVVLAALGLLPPIAMLVFWNEPTQTMSESISEARRE